MIETAKQNTEGQIEKQVHLETTNYKYSDFGRALELMFSGVIIVLAMCTGSNNDKIMPIMKVKHQLVFPQPPLKDIVNQKCYLKIQLIT